MLCGAGLLAGLYVLTWQTYRSDRLAFWVVVAGLSLPAFAACSLIMTIDAPFLCCWAWALVFGRWALVDGKAWAWVPAGFLVGARHPGQADDGPVALLGRAVRAVDADPPAAC